MEYTIRLSGMEFHAMHGCYELERRVGNKFEVDVTIRAEMGEAAARDDVSLTVNYLTVYEVVAEQMACTQCTLERVATNIIEALHRRFEAIRHVETTVSKIAPPLGGKVARVSVSLAD